MKYSLFIGRWQPFHDGHRWLINERLKEGKNVCIAIREIDQNNQNNYNPIQIKKNIESELKELIKVNKVKVIIIPDIESINYGSGVGYDIIQHFPPRTIMNISPTEIREKLQQSANLKKNTK
jgi:nicotinamide mononucleotide adenylyltransferase